MTEVDEELHLDWRWIIMAPKKSGSGWHVDPANTTGWLALVAGAKLWGLYPPSEYQIAGKLKIFLNYMYMAFLSFIIKGIRTALHSFCIVKNLWLRGSTNL
jgi:hypothetical protein